MIFLWFNLFIVLATLYNVVCDQLDYNETIAVLAGHDYLDSNEIFTAYTEVSTSQSYLSGTVDNVYITFVGEFSSSGPHLFGSFEAGSISEFTTVLSRPIGSLQSVLFQKDGYDGWLLYSLRCRINSRTYEFTGSSQWLDNFDPELYAETGNGYEPDSVLDLSELPASGKMEYTVASSSYFYTT